MKLITVMVSTLSLIICFLTLSSSTSCPEPHHCVCDEAKNSTKCSSNNDKKFQKLYYIPELPDYVKYVTLSGNLFENITQETFFNLTKLKLKTLLLFNNKIKNISPDAFEKLTYLRHLEISQNKELKPEILSRSLNSLNKSVIEKLRFIKNNWTWLPDDMFAGLKDSRIKVICLKLNKIKTVNCSMFLGLHNLEDVSFSSNDFLHSISLKGLPPKVKYLDLSVNNLVEMPSFCDDNSTLLPSISYLNLNKNHLDKLSADNFKCLDKAKKIGLDENDIFKLENNVLRHATSLTDISFEHQRAKFKRIEPFAFNSSSLLWLNFARNGFTFKVINKDIFKVCTNLTYLKLDNNLFEMKFNFSQVRLVRQLLLPLRKLKTLMLNACGLTELPKQLFQHMVRLETLSLYGNSVIGWNDDPAVFGNITWLKTLYMAGNLIRLVNKTSFPEEFLTKLSNIDLSFNEFSCTCDLLWFRDWLRKNKTIQVKGWPRSYYCKFPPSMTGQRLVTFNPTAESCLLPNPILIVAIVLSVVFVSVAIVITVLYKSRWHIRYWIYLLRARRSGYINLHQDKGFDYDGFVVYSKGDEDWVHNILLPKLENEYGYHLCVHQRDFDVGKPIIDNIVDNMNKSKKILIILSEDFAQSDWCQFELRVSQDRFLNSDNISLVLIMLQEIGHRHLTSSLRALITTTTYASWTPDGVGQSTLTCIYVET
ncbi:hypothetical protein KUTeg_021700 [Tegillarca granosa]|uniref:TIR domain-containing protein n=1 Tax=Tegillarca granosa TaxID=220873 RepID=A0ABQ9E708_TEGGR|nr:hypothetical protein KUTeg_021700 [Tegillarca granosa]